MPGERAEVPGGGYEGILEGRGMKRWLIWLPLVLSWLAIAGCRTDLRNLFDLY